MTTGFGVLKKGTNVAIRLAMRGAIAPQHQRGHEINEGFCSKYPKRGKLVVPLILLAQNQQRSKSVELFSRLA